MDMEARNALKMTLNERLDIEHVDLVFESLAWELAQEAFFLSHEKREQLRQGGWECRSGVEHVVKVITGRSVIGVRPHPPDIDYGPIERPPPYELPKPLDPGGPTKLRDTFTYEVRVVDELGEPIDDVTMLIADSPPTKTDGDGRVLYEDGSSSRALARLIDSRQLRKVVIPRWEKIRDGEWLDETDEHTYLDSADPLQMVPVRTDRLHTIVIQPRVICARILELLFDTNKTFLLPSALEHIREVRNLYDERPRAQLLIVGHTDTTGDPEVNDPLSLNRAKSIKAYLTDDVDTWLDFYGDHMHSKARWGATEDSLMLDAILTATGEELTDTLVRHYQATRGLQVDGKVGDNTRRALITEYMAFDGTTLPKHIEPVVHGCGGNFPLETPERGEAAHAHDRRVELYFFDPDLGVLPPPPGESSSPEDPEYLEWRRRSVETHIFITRKDELPFRFSE
jgi:hypothetical protein